MPKATTPNRGQNRHNPLADDYLVTAIPKNKAPKKKSSRKGEDGEAYVDAKASEQILKLGRQLAEEDAQVTAPPESNAFGFESRFPQEQTEPFGHDDEVEAEAWGDEEEEVEELHIEPEDLETFNKFLGADEVPGLAGHDFFSAGASSQESFVPGGDRSLADIILSKIAAHEAGVQRAPAGPVDDEDLELPPKVIEVYTKIGLMLSRYKSGKLPKPFKILPTIPQWEQIIGITKPWDWSPNAVFEATRIFVSSTPQVVQRFLELVVLEKVKEDIYENKKLNVHLFNALKKSLYKPASFFKGFLFPLVASGSCTLLEARIVSAVLVRVHIPVLHSAAAIKGLCDIAAEEASAGTEGGGATNIFIKALLEKRYALPFQVVDGLVFHFLRMRSMDPAAAQRSDVMDMGGERAATQSKLPVLYHQCLLMFAERYRNEITEDQREALLDLLLTHGHPKIAPEIRRELLAGRGRGVALEQQEVALDNDDTMMVID